MMQDCGGRVAAATDHAQFNRWPLGDSKMK